ncbi:hypothetical protein JRO89_XS03G0332700 [Xanthoceras sorbifolium]|uniref:Pectinesterase inhibitor domain-containing protein n=1 Tax=Xanthoceras sorbifolium TaxID=99658 RepID=A0ABQ8IDG5_9ROSI|nr:hypothetical protein JRO89_XS03G0332700 [Xanthoceras sorbifolium]
MTSVFRLSLDQLPEHAAAANLKTLADFSLKSTYDRGVNQQCLHLRAPGAATADLKTLDDFSLKSTATDVSTNQAYINSQLPNVKDPKVKQVLNHCKINYDGSQASLQLAIGSLAANNFAAVDMYGEMAWENMNDCARVIKQGPPPPGLPGRNAKTLQLIDVTMVISNMLVPYQL